MINNSFKITLIAVLWCVTKIKVLLKNAQKLPNSLQASGFRWFIKLAITGSMIDSSRERSRPTTLYCCLLPTKSALVDNTDRILFFKLELWCSYKNSRGVLFCVCIIDASRYLPVQ